MSLRHPLARAKGLGASGDGSHHWWLQRVSALALIPLSIWFVFSVVHHINDDHDVILAWVAQPVVAVMLILYLSFMFFHAQLGLQVVVEDYVHEEKLKTGILLVIKGTVILAGVMSVFSVLRVAI